MPDINYNITEEPKENLHVKRQKYCIKLKLIVKLRDVNDNIIIKK